MMRSFFLFAGCGVGGERFDVGGLGGIPAVGRSGMKVSTRHSPITSTTISYIQRNIESHHHLSYRTHYSHFISSMSIHTCIYMYIYTRAHMHIYICIYMSTLTWEKGIDLIQHIPFFTYLWVSIVVWRKPTVGRANSFNLRIACRNWWKRKVILHLSLSLSLSLSFPIMMDYRYQERIRNVWFFYVNLLQHVFTPPFFLFSFFLKKNKKICAVYRNRP